MAGAQPKPAHTTPAKMKSTTPAAKMQQHDTKGWVMPEAMSQEQQSIVQALRRIVTARTMAEHYEAFNTSVAPDITWDAPPILLHHREAMRPVVYAAKTVAHLNFDVIMAKMERMSTAYERLHLEVMFHVMPIQPLNWVLPADIPIRASIIVGVRKSGQAAPGNMLIDHVWARWHNIPIVPTLFRRATGLLMGQTLRLTENVWTRGLPLIGDTSMVHHHPGTTNTSTAPIPSRPTGPRTTGPITG